ncbi:MAG: hypothetical protein UV73_C0016G0011 [Candidatus Gottesmanbacteria bacterium GW2011_GWA2_43_14]|uniref:Uncharacterized protein n=1 Tax=Candidatus Gottesmanbacteria bacterium GW2011_GWA2_43_14 TaxID=1618443 RepID=A0A0G1DCJ9_9BACT|nr:MAG: hypothetical protein UV73_C0016G0011 [Candidatus Gottesmanbacteria bacterium GW2011_GWA2_43_14]
MKKNFLKLALILFSYLIFNIVLNDAAYAAVCKGTCEFYADGCKKGSIETKGQCDAPLICCESTASTPKPIESCNSGNCKNDCLCKGNTPSECNAACGESDETPKEPTVIPTPAKKPGETEDVCSGTCRFYGDGCRSGEKKTIGVCSEPLICCEKPTSPGKTNSCQGKCEYYLEGCGFGLSVSSHSCGSDKLICCEPKDGVIDPKMGTYIPDCDGTWVPEDIPCSLEGESNGAFPGFNCCNQFSNPGMGVYNPIPDQAARDALELYGYWHIPITSCYGQCEWGSDSCSIFNKLPAYGTCPGQKDGAPVACCGESIANAGAGQCLKGQNYCEDGDFDSVNICRPDKKGYAKYSCAEGYFCPPGGSHCIPSLTAEDILNPQKGKIFESCNFNFECATNYCNPRINKCDLNIENTFAMVQNSLLGTTYQNENPISPYIPVGWSGLSSATEIFLNEVLNNITNFNAYCDPNDSKYNLSECGESIATGLGLSLIVAAPELLPALGPAEQALQLTLFNLASKIPEAGLIGASARIISKFAIPAATTYDAYLINLYKTSCNFGDIEACGIAQDLAISSYAGWTAYTWNLLPDLSHPEYGRLVDVNFEDDLPTVLPPGMINYINPDDLDTVYPPVNLQPAIVAPEDLNILGKGSFGVTYLGPDNTLYKIYDDPKRGANIAQMEFYKNNKGKHWWVTFKGYITQNGKVVGFKSQYFPNTISWKDFTLNGGKLTEYEIERSIRQFDEYQSTIGMTHTDLFRWPDMVKLDPKIANYERYGWLKANNILVYTSPVDGSRWIIPIDFQNWGGATKYLYPAEKYTYEEALELERNFFEYGLRKFSLGY